MHATTKTRPEAELDGLEPGESLPISPGETIGGKYRIERILGIGGMAIVAQAKHENLKQQVALKLMRTARMTPNTVDRFLREARAAVRLKSEHVARVLDVGTLESGLPFMVMEFLAGDDLGVVMERRGAMPIGESISVILEVCDAISEAHSLGIVHRDLKPANLFLTQRRDGTPMVKVLDFGISKLLITDDANPNDGDDDDDDARPMHMHESGAMGSPAYMSPEQVRSTKDVDVRTDIWSLGVILFEMLTGNEPFHAHNITDVLQNVLQKPTPPLAKLRPDLPPGLVQVVMKCLEKKREKRFATVDELAVALLAFADKETSSKEARWKNFVQVDVDVVEPHVVPSQLSIPTPNPTLDEIPPSSKSKPKLPIASITPPSSLSSSTPQSFRVPHTPAATIVLPGRPAFRRKRRGIYALVALIGMGLVGAYLVQASIRGASSSSAKTTIATTTTTTTTTTTQTTTPSATPLVTPSGSVSSPTKPPEETAAMTTTTSTTTPTPKKGTAALPLPRTTTTTTTTTTAATPIRKTAAPVDSSFRRTDW